MRWPVKIPLVQAVVMPGFNRTIMYVIAKLVTTALIGTNGLKQVVYISVSDGSIGVCIVAVAEMVIIAVAIDRMNRGLAQKTTNRARALRGVTRICLEIPSCH